MPDDLRTNLLVSPGLGLEPEGVRDEMALCLSGGGYRSMLFQLGSLWRLNEAGLLSKIKRFSSVSGGSITAGRLAIVWNDLTWINGIATDFYNQVVQPVRDLGYRTLDRKAVLEGALLPGVDSSDLIVKGYDDYLFQGKTLQDLPAPSTGPEFMFCATNVQSGVLFRMTRAYLWDYRVGRFDNPGLPVSHAVTASSAFPPVLSPFRIDCRKWKLQVTPGTGTDLESETFTEFLYLTDGGVYDNLGIEGAWKSFRTVFVSDAELGFDAEVEPSENYLGHLRRVAAISGRQSVALRKRFLIDAYQTQPKARLGCYWCNRGDVQKYQSTPPATYPFPIPQSEAETRDLANYGTRLARVETDVQERLINWAYLICDMSLRKNFDSTLPVPANLPYPGRRISK
jgi:NTE family protein